MFWMLLERHRPHRRDRRARLREYGLELLAFTPSQ
ncbi:MAG: hypothetical protein ACM3QU_09675 [Verrucomicrobiota bacterium]